MRSRIARRLNALWYSNRTPPALLRTAAAAYEYWVQARLERPAARPPCPVIVVGNLVAGGSGKTPVVAALAEALDEAGFAVSIVSRGYGGAHRRKPVRVGPGSDSAQVGDEALALCRRTGTARRSATRHWRFAGAPAGRSGYAAGAPPRWKRR